MAEIQSDWVLIYRVFYRATANVNTSLVSVGQAQSDLCRLSAQTVQDKVVNVVNGSPGKNLWCGVYDVLVQEIEIGGKKLGVAAMNRNCSFDWHWFIVCFEFSE